MNDSSAPVDCIRAILFDADGKDRALALEALDLKALSAQQLLWIDVQCGDAALLTELGRRLDLHATLVAALQTLDGGPRLENHGERFHIQAVAVEHVGEIKFKGRVLALVGGPNFVVTVHREQIAFLEQLRERERGETELGALSGESFIASLLDWQLSTYFEAVSDLEAAVDRLEIGILSERRRDSLPELRHLRRAASRLRRMLAPHRAIFAGLARPDFRPRTGGEANVHFLALDTRYERAMDIIESAREMVVGSFELFTTRMAQRTNDTMRVLTFFTVLLGSIAVLAGVLGMNFQAPFFATGARGFWTAVGAMFLMLVGSLALARMRRWF